jgi:hypothetical protein
MLPPRAKNVLVIRSASHYALLQALETLREDAGAERFGILVQPAWIESVAPYGQVHRYPDDDRFSADRLDETLIDEMRAAGYDLAVAIYATSFGTGYANVDELLERVLVPRRLGYDADRDEWLDLSDPAMAAARVSAEAANRAYRVEQVAAIERVKAAMADGR